MLENIFLSINQLSTLPLQEKPGWLLWSGSALLALVVLLMKQLLTPLASEYYSIIQLTDITELTVAEVISVSYIGLYLALFGFLAFFLSCCTRDTGKVIVGRMRKR